MNTCGRPEHDVLGFGATATQPTAAYPALLCHLISDILIAGARLTTSAEGARASAEVVAEGRVKRHTLRGDSIDGAKVLKRAEDEKALAGMRNPASVCKEWPSLVEAMRPVQIALLAFQRGHPEFQGLGGACGATPARAPPSEAGVKTLQAKVAKAIGISVRQASLSHPASTWRYEVVKAIQQACSDPDVHLATWLRDGAPMGLSRPIEPSGLFPAEHKVPIVTLDELAAMEVMRTNHPSFADHHGESKSPGVALLEDQVNKGFALLFSDQPAAEAFLGGKAHPAPLGNIAKAKADGSMKYRLIQDQRRNWVNSAVEMPERQVLPRPIDHARDLGLLVEGLRKDEVLTTLVLDFKDAFMSVPLHPDERRFNCAKVEEPVHRERAALFPDETVKGKFVVWQVLGFGGRPNPLIYSRAASFAMRSAQALVGFPSRRTRRDLLSRTRGQLYVDDPAWTFAGREGDNERTMDIILMWWLALGIPLSWGKGAVYTSESPHTWIGVEYLTTPDSLVLMKIPEAFVQAVLLDLDAFLGSDRSVPASVAERLVGRTGRIAQIVPSARPFASALYAAKAAAGRAEAWGHREAPPGRVATNRFRNAASWFKALLHDPSLAPVLLQRVVHPHGPASIPSSNASVEFDASPWGGGAILRINGVAKEYFACGWSKASAAHLNVVPGDCKFQSFWEFLTLLLALILWGDAYTDESLTILGDNSSALQNALKLAGRREMVAVAREIAWRQIRGNWAFKVGHLPAEQNLFSDALSRRFAPAPEKLPKFLAKAIERRALEPMQVWRAATHFDLA